MRWARRPVSGLLRGATASPCDVETGWSPSGGQRHGSSWPVRRHDRRSQASRRDGSRAARRSRTSSTSTAKTGSPHIRRVAAAGDTPDMDGLSSRVVLSPRVRSATRSCEFLGSGHEGDTRLVFARHVCLDPHPCQRSPSPHIENTPSLEFTRAGQSTDAPDDASRAATVRARGRLRRC